MLKKSLAILLAATMSVLLFAGCGQSKTAAATSAQPTKDSVKMVISADMSTFDPHNTTAAIDFAIHADVFETLLDYYQGTFTPVLCDSYNISTDGLTYTFKITQGVKFQNGDVMTAADVAYSLQRAQTSTQYKSNMTDIDSIAAPDASTVTVKLKKVDAPFLILIASQVKIIDQKATTASGYDIKTQPIGTGPYKLVKWNAGQNIILTRFDDYHGAKPQIKDATYTVITDASSAQMALQSKDADLTYSVPSSSVAQLQTDSTLSVTKVPMLCTGFIVYDLEKAPFNDVNFRLALSYAIDKQQLIDVAMDGNGEVATGLWSKDSVGYTGNVQFNSYDLDKAKAALAQSSYSGQSISLKVKDDATYQKIATLLQEDLRKVGITVEVSQEETNSWITDLTKGNYEMSFASLTMNADVANWANAFASTGIGVLNFSHLNVPEIDQAFTSARSTVDTDQRGKYYDQIAQYIKDQGIVVPCYFKVGIAVYNKTLTVSRFYPTGYAKIKDMSWVS